MRRIFLIPLVWSMVTMAGCTTFQPPLGIFQPDGSALSRRELQTRVYTATNEIEMLASTSAVLQDLGFTVEATEKKLGLIVASKDRSAVNKSAVAGAITLDIAAAVLAGMGGGGYSAGSFYQSVDKVQKIRASVVVKPNDAKTTLSVRVTFQRVVWNMAGDISRMETLDDQELYQGFFNELGKAQFLEAQKI